MKLLKTFIVCTTLALTACNNPSLEPLPRNEVILAFGDSLTAGKGANKELSYPAALARLSGREVINAGVSGETTAQGLRRFPEVLKKSDPGLLVLMHGGNDILRDLSSSQAKTNLTEMINMAKDRGVQVLLVGLPEKSLLSSSAPLYKELANEFDLVLEESIISKLLKRPALKSDAVHFNAEGYNEIAKTLYELLQDRGAL